MPSLRILILFSMLFPAVTAGAAVTDLDHWTLVEDPPHAGFSASSNAASATLSATGPAVPRAVDIGYQSVNGQNSATSESGFFFDVDNDFSIAISYDLSFSNSPSGGLGLGFGVGEDADGMNSVGVAMVTSSGSPFLSFAGAARTNDVNQAQLIGLASSLEGTLFVDYVASNGNLTVGAATSSGADSPTASTTFLGLQNDWNDRDLMASFFIRSDGGLPGTQWLGGNADAVFSDFRIRSGSAVAIPEPTTTTAMLIGTCGILVRRRRRI